MNQTLKDKRLEGDPLYGLQIKYGSMDASISQENLTEITKAYVDEVHSFEDHEERAKTQEYKEAYFKEILLKDPNTILIFDGDKLVAWAGMKNHGMQESGNYFIELKAITVLPEYRGRGISKSLTKMREEKAIAEHPSGVVLGMLSRNPRIIESNTKKDRGWEPENPRSFFEELGCDMNDKGVEDQIKWLESIKAQALINRKHSKPKAVKSVIDIFHGQLVSKLGAFLRED